MGTSKNFDELLGKLIHSGRVLVDGNAERVKVLTKLVQRTVDAQVVQGVGADHIFRNNRNRPIGTSVKVLSTGADAQALVRARGPMSWLEYGIAPHPVIPGGRNKRARGLLGSALGGAEGPFLPASSLFGPGNYAASTKGAGVVLKFGGKLQGKFSRYAENSGTLKPRHSWSHGVDHAVQLAPTEAMKVTVRQIGSVFA